MTEHTVHIPANTASRTVFMRGTADEKAEAEHMITANKAAWETVLDTPGLTGFSFKSGNQMLILTRSLRREGVWQLSYFDRYGAVGDGKYSIKAETADNCHTRGELLQELYTHSRGGTEVTVMCERAASISRIKDDRKNIKSKQDKDINQVER